MEDEVLSHEEASRQWLLDPASGDLGGAGEEPGSGAVKVEIASSLTCCLLVVATNDLCAWSCRSCMRLWSTRNIDGNQEAKLKGCVRFLNT